MDIVRETPFGRPALEAMLVELRPRLHRYCARMAGSVIDGEDIVQESLIKALLFIGDNASVERPEQWIFRIAHNAAQDHLRRRNRENLRMIEADITMIEDPSSFADARLAAATTLRSFMGLTLVQRSAVILVDVLGLGLQEACEVTGSTLASTKAALHRGRTELKRQAAAPDASPPPKLEADEQRRLRHYVDLFNARDFDAVRALIAEDIHLDVVNRAKFAGKTQASTYFGSYDRAADWFLSLGFVESRPAILSRDPQSKDGAVQSFMLLDWAGERVSQIRDFRYAAYCVLDADIRPLGR